MDAEKCVEASVVSYFISKGIPYCLIAINTTKPIIKVKYTMSIIDIVML